jgi:hypothetical protein
MSSFPNLSNLAGYVKSALDRRIGNVQNVSQLNAWVRVSSGVGGGLMLLSNPNFALFRAAGEGSIYGDGKSSGTLGTSWGGAAIYAETSDSGFRPKPNITSIEIDEGAGTLSRKASFTITCYTKGQLDTLCEYFLEPGYSIFLEWGWNVPESLKAYSSTLNSTTVANFQSFKKVNEARANSKGTYDNYLGFITGGGISSNGDTYEISVKCTGFTELPAYFMGADNSEDSENEEKITEPEYSTAQISAETNLGKKRFMMAFNRLPSNRRTTRVSSLIVNPLVANPSNFINVDETVKAKVNECVGGTELLGISINDEEANVGGVTQEFPSGTEIIKDESFIRFGTLMEILNQIGMEGFMIGGKVIKTTINTKTTVCCAFPKIFSTDKKKLFIPNKTAPLFDLVKAANSPTDNGVSDAATDDCSVVNVNDSANLIMFPAAGTIANGIANGKVVVSNKIDGSFEALTKPNGQWGFLDDLYVNLDFAKGVLETKNFSIRNALYQILNGMSAAAGGLWDFQIMSDEDDTELRVVDMNLTPTGVQEPYQFVLAGVNSIFIDASLDMDISGAKMNQIIGNRLGQTINGSQKDVKSKDKKGLFTNKDDQILKEIKKREEPPPPKDATPPEGPTDDELEEAKIKNLQLFLDKIGLMPRPHLDDKYPFEADLKKSVFTVAYNDQAVFEFFKNQNDKTAVQTEPGGVGPIMPIKFTFTIHGLSGIKRGDKFKVLGLPKNYESTGFFQVTSVKHTITDMLWKTDIEGSFRQSR